MPVISHGYIVVSAQISMYPRQLLLFSSYVNYCLVRSWVGVNLMSRVASFCFFVSGEGPVLCVCRSW